MTQTTFDLDISQIRAASWLPCGEGRCGPRLPKLLPLRYTETEQRSQPSQPRTRLVKDVLRTGRWKVGANADGSPRWWHVTEQVLQQIEEGFVEARAAGNAFNLCWGHGNPQTRIVDSRDTIEPLDQVFRQGDTLWATVYVDMATAAALRKAARKVSVRVVGDWTDGAGHVYPMALLHVAVVDLPVLTGQGPFLDLAHPSSLKGTTPMDFQTQLELWQRALAALGLALPESTTEETLPVVVDALLHSLEGETDEPGDPTPPAESETLPALTPAAGASLPAELGSLITGLTDQIKDLSLRVDSLKTDGARSAFTSKLESLAKSGRINAKAVTSLTQTGEKHSWDLSLLTPFEDLQMVDMTRRAKSLATSKAPSTAGIAADLSDEDIKAGAEWIRTGKLPAAKK